VLLPMYFLIGIWGGDSRVYASIKFVLFTLAGSLLMLVSIVVLYGLQFGQTGETSMAMIDFYSLSLDPSTAFWLFIGFALAFAIKTPLFPVHTWLPDAHVEAPTPISVILAGILLKMGAYGFFRIAFPFFPDAAVHFAWFLGLLGLINVIYGSLCAMAQQDMKKLVAYSSIGHMGYMLLGMASFVQIGLLGGHFQMFTHGLSSGLLFMLVGVLYDRAHHRNIDGFGGMATYMPVYAGFMMVGTFAGLGLPSLAPFISESFSFLGAFQSDTTRIFAMLGVSGILLTAGYMLWMYQRIFFEEPNPKYEEISGINLREMVAAAPLIILILVLGVYPAPYIEIVEESILRLQSMIP